MGMRNYTIDELREIWVGLAHLQPRTRQYRLALRRTTVKLDRGESAVEATLNVLRRGDLGPRAHSNRLSYVTPALHAYIRGEGPDPRIVVEPEPVPEPAGVTLPAGDDGTVRITGGYGFAAHSAHHIDHSPEIVTRLELACTLLAELRDLMVHHWGALPVREQLSPEDAE